MPHVPSSLPLEAGRGRPLPIETDADKSSCTSAEFLVHPTSYRPDIKPANSHIMLDFVRYRRKGLKEAVYTQGKSCVYPVRIVRSHPLQSNLGSLGAIVRRCWLLEPGMLQRLLRGNAVLGIVDEDLPQKIQEVLKVSSVRWDDVLVRVSLPLSNLV